MLSNMFYEVPGYSVKQGKIFTEAESMLSTQ